MNKSKLIIHFAVITLMITCCSKSENAVDKNSCVNIEISQKDIREFVKTSDIFEDIWRVPLETNSENIIGNIDRMFVHDSLIYILDYKQDIVFIFTINGRYFSKISSKGSGPKEYLKIDDAYIINSKNEFVICDMMNHKSMHYSSLGEFIFEEKNPLGNENFYCMTELPNGHLFYYIGQKNTYNTILKKHNAVILTKDNKILPFFPQLDGELKLKMASTDSYLFNSGKDFFLHIPFHKEIYEIEGTDIFQKYNINILNKMFPDEAYFSPNNEYFMSKYIESDNYICLIGTIKASQNYIIIPMLKGMKFYGNTWISRKTNKVLVSKKIVDEQNKELSLIALCTKGDTIICITSGGDPEELEANPILTMYKLKKF